VTRDNIALIFLGLIALACVVGAIFLGADGKDVPESIIAIGAGAAGALGGVVTVNRQGGA
jgi:hypothetical protein